MLKMIVAVGNGNAIGKEGSLIWHLPEDLRYFKETTTGHPVIMGRRTWESLPKGALPGRRNMVISRNPQYEVPGAELFPSLESALKAIREDEDPFILGGGQLYREALSLTDCIHRTRIYADAPDADTFFPVLSPEDWELDESCSSELMLSPKSCLEFRFEVLRRLKKA